MSQVNLLTWRSLTAIVNTIKSPNSFVKKLLFTNHESLPVEVIEIPKITDVREAAPFVRKNGEAIMVGGMSMTSQLMEGPNIRIKRPFNPSQVLFQRDPGTIQYASSGADPRQSANVRITREVAKMADMITNAEEWLCCSALTGVIAYEVEDEEVFTMTFSRPSNTNIDLTTYWDDATPSDVRVLADILTVKTAMSDNDCPAPTDAICGTEAAAALLELVESGNLKLISEFNYNSGQGGLSFNEQFREDGVIYLGTIGGIRFWLYGRTCLINGVSTPMIRAKYVEFVSTLPSADVKLYYAAIADVDALEGMLFQGERFSKSWKQPDPSALMHLIHSRPFPVMRRPGSNVSMKVVSG